MILVTLKTGQKRAFSEKVIWGVQEITAADKAQMLANPDPKITPQDRQDIMKSNTRLFSLIKGPDLMEFHVAETFEQVGAQMEGVCMTDNDGGRLKLDSRYILHVTDLRLEDRKENLHCLSRIQTTIMTARGQVQFEVCEGVDFIVSAIKRENINHETHETHKK